MSTDFSPPPSDDESLGRAANRYVTFRIWSAVIGGILFLIMLFGFFLPQFNRVNQGFSNGPSQAMSPQGTSTMTIDGRPATPEEQRSFDQAAHNSNSSPSSSTAH